MQERELGGPTHTKVPKPKISEHSLTHISLTSSCEDRHSARVYVTLLSADFEDQSWSIHGATQLATPVYTVPTFQIEGF